MKEKHPYRNADAEENERRERIDFQEEIEREAQEKQTLLQCIVNEEEATGYPLPPSMVKLLHSNNGKLLNNLSFKFTACF